MQEGQSRFGLSELVPAQSEQVLDPSEWPFGWAGCLLVQTGLQGWAGSEGCVSGSWGSASLSWGQNENLCSTEEELSSHSRGKLNKLPHLCKKFDLMSQTNTYLPLV